MTATSTFFSGTDWEQSSGPYVNRYWEEADLWPEGAGGEIDQGHGILPSLRRLPKQPGYCCA